MKKLLFEKETYNIIGCCMEVHNTLGYGFKEIIYKDALEIEFQLRKIPYKREPFFDVDYKGIILPHGFNADFLVYDSIVLEAKSRVELEALDYVQIFNYLKSSKLKIGLLANFGESRLNHKRIIL